MERKKTSPRNEVRGLSIMSGGDGGRSKSDYEVVCMISERMGLLKEYTEGRSVEE